MSILKKTESGTTLATLCRKNKMSNTTFYEWCAKYGGMDRSLILRFSVLEAKKQTEKNMLKSDLRLRCFRKQCQKSAKAILPTSDSSITRCPT